MSTRVSRKAAQLKKTAFLDAYRDCGNISAAARLADVPREDHYYWLKTDPQYAQDFAAAEEVAIDALETEARRRAIEGVAEPVYWDGMQVGTKQRYSDTLLIFLLKGARPHKYRERVDVTVSVRQQAEKIAGELGVSVDEVIAEANRIVAEAQHEGTPA